MVQFIFFVDGLGHNADEAAVIEAAKQVFPQAEIKLDAMTSSMTITTSQEEGTDQTFARLSDALATLGCTLKLPPSSVTVRQTPVVSSKKDAPRQKKKRRIPWGAFIATTCALLILAILTTYTLTAAQFGQKLKELQDEFFALQEEAGNQADQEPEIPSAEQPIFPELEVFDFLFDQYAIEDIDQEALMEAVLKAYAIGTGDIYAEYYTAEEFEAMMQEDQGNMEGIGVSVTNDVVVVNGLSYQVLTVISVFRDSPALNAGVRVGDHIYTVTDADGVSHTVEELGYDGAISCVRGISGTNAEFSALRKSSDGGYQTVTFSITRAPITTETVTSHVLASDPSIGILKISQFDLTTPGQFCANMDALIEAGCTKFIFDVRYNPGGLLISIEAVLSTLLNEGDVMISTVYKDGSEETDVVKPVSYSGVYNTCSVAPEDIGKYKGYEFAVLTNEYTASAAELFSANIRDYELGTLVGVTTYGKGCMQTTFDLSYFGYEGALKLTTAWYQPPCGENYHGVGIEPHIPVETDLALIEQYGNIYLIPDDEDPQIHAAIEALNQ